MPEPETILDIYRKHIGLILLLVFTSSHWIGAATATHNLYQLYQVGEYNIVWSFQCEAGHMVSDNSDSPLEFISNSGSEGEKGTLIVSNCGTSLQFISTGLVDFDRPDLAGLPDSEVTLLTPQLFVQKIADPPRLA